MLFEEDSDLETNFKTNHEYAKNYNVWRKKEELNKLKTKYGDELEMEDDSSSSSEDDEHGVELTEKVEKDFFKTLAYLKNKDPRIYDKNVTFFEDKIDVPTNQKKKKDRPMFLKDYERNIILEKGGILSDEDNDERPRSPTYVEEQKHIKDKLKEALNAIEEDDECEWGGIFKERQKTESEKEKEESDYKKWLAGHGNKLDDNEVVKELKPLKDYWNKPDLDDGEKFLRDYILNKKFLDNDNDEYVPTYDEIINDSLQDLSNDEEMIEKQEEFEHKYNFRFEEPDQDFIKRFPRTMESSLRKTDDRRKVKRQEVKERKKKEKEEKMQDLKKLQELKRKEIEEKLVKLKEITGNPSIGFENEYLDGDFDPEEHDKKMQALFNDQFYDGEEEEQKPEFPDLDEELEIENWECYNTTNEDNEAVQPHCEDENFIMDCDYDPKASTQKYLIENSKTRQKKKRKSKFAEAISQPKPKFDPAKNNYEKYFDEYYKLDCEDIIGDIPCRFKYREVVPNDFGLTVEEILLAKERELNKWCSLKKTVQIRPEHVERYEQIAYKKKGQNVNLKKKILPSIFTPDSEETIHNKTEPNLNNLTGESTSQTASDQNEFEHEKINGKTELRSKKKKKNVRSYNKLENMKQETISSVETQHNSVGTANLEQNSKKVDNKDNRKGDKNQQTENVATKKKTKKVKIYVSNKNSDEGHVELVDDAKKKQADNSENKQIIGKKRKRHQADQQKKYNSVPKKKFKKDIKVEKPLSAITDARLLAYGIKPKKFKNKLKYKK